MLLPRCAAPLSPRSWRRGRLRTRATNDAGRGHTVARRVWRAVNRPAVWRAATAVSATALGALIFLAGPGSVQVLTESPPVGAAHVPSWAVSCAAVRPAAPGVNQLAYCARVDGRVIGSTSEGGERHVIVTGGFHVTLVELPRGVRTPAWGSRIVAVGSLQSASFGLRELIVERIHE